MLHPAASSQTPSELGAFARISQKQFAEQPPSPCIDPPGFSQEGPRGVADTMTSLMISAVIVVVVVVVFVVVVESVLVAVREWVLVGFVVL